eukprot:UN12618
MPKKFKDLINKNLSNKSDEKRTQWNSTPSLSRTCISIKPPQASSKLTKEIFKQKETLL